MFRFPVCGETTNDIAEQCNLMFEILAVVNEKTVDDLYNDLVDAHMTDSVEHNKGFAKILQDMYNLDDSKGQLFCGVHTTLGFSSAMNKVMGIVERDMTLEAILENFKVDLDFDSKHGSLAGQACDVILRLIAPEFRHKSWNYYESFLSHLKKAGAEEVLFAYKDHRFGCLSRACAVIVYIKEYLCTWLEDNPGVTNRLACLVRDMLKVDYLDVAFSVFAALGIQLIEPFLAYTTSSVATHSNLKDFYQSLHDRMDSPVTEEFFQFNNPWFTCVSANMFEKIQNSYNSKVVEVVKNKSLENIDECVMLANLIMPELKTVLGRQRRDYGLSSNFPEEYPVNQQASNIDDTPVHNLGMERLCGLVGYRAQKLQTLEAVSRSIILDAAGKIRSDADVSFRQFRAKACAIRELKLNWGKKMKERFKQKLNEKQAVSIEKEEKRLEMREVLKSEGGPFTKHDDVEEFCTGVEQQVLAAKSEPEKKDIQKETQKRLKLEVKFARESSTTLPKKDDLFRIQVTLANNKRRDKNVDEFATSLKALLGRKCSRRTLSLATFKTSLSNVSNQRKM